MQALPAMLIVVTAIALFDTSVYRALAPAALLLPRAVLKPLLPPQNMSMAAVAPFSTILFRPPGPPATQLWLRSQATR